MVVAEEHKTALTCAEHLLVTGGPGSGKTTFALLKAQHLISNRIEDSQHVLFLSFSRAAVARIVQASKHLLTSQVLSRISIQTFHSFFWEVLRSYGYLLGAPKRLSLLAPHDERALSDGIKQTDTAWKQWTDTREKMFNESGRTAFDLFAPKTLLLLSGAKSIAQLVCTRYPVIIVDEAQDTSSDQWAIMKILSQFSQLVCLADLDQQIFDFLPGVGPERVKEIEKDLQPLIVELGSENKRSGGTDILHFGNDILNNSPRAGAYLGVSLFNFQSKAERRDAAIRQSVGMMNNIISKKMGRPPLSIGILASYDLGVTIVSNALRTGTEIPHRVLFDDTRTLLASRFLAFLLEPKQKENTQRDTITAITLIDAITRSDGTTTSRKNSTKLNLWIASIQGGKTPATKLINAIGAILAALHQNPLTGNPAKDWMYIRSLLRQSDCAELVQIDKDLNLLIAYNRGKRIYGGLVEAWQLHDSYVSARSILDAALAEDQLLSDREDLAGIHVMNMHKSKGKQFEGVIIFRTGNHAPFVWYYDSSPYHRSRKILRVAVTRAEQHVLILNDVYSTCPILSSFKL